MVSRNRVGSWYMCFFATLFAFAVQTSMQRFTTPTHTALIFCMEPVFAALFAYMLISERWDLWGLVGACCILAGMIISEIPYLRFSFLRRACSNVMT